MPLQMFKAGKQSLAARALKALWLRHDMVEDGTGGHVELRTVGRTA